jgi:drug/metabolite transporter (DMT)-like permease
MDMSNVTRSMWIVVGGTAATLIGTLLLDWYSVTKSITVQGIGTLATASASAGAWDMGSVGKLAVLGSLVMLAGVVLLFIPNPPELPFALPMAILVVSAFTALMVVLKFIDLHHDTALGLWLTLVGALVAAYGAYEMGGRFSMSSSS